MRLFAPVSLLVGLLGCGDGGGASGPDGGRQPDSGGPADDAGPPDPIFRDDANLVLVRESEWRGDEAYVTSGAIAQIVTSGIESYLTETMREGNCRLLESDASYCESCDGFCVAGECRPWPVYRSAGRISLTGLAVPLSLDWSGFYYEPSRYDLPADLFGAGDAIGASAAGEEVAPFELDARGVDRIDPDLEGDCDNELHLEDGRAAVLGWSDADPGGRVRVWMPSTNNGHGLPPKAVIECEGPDTGTMTVPQALVAAFPTVPGVLDYCEGIACVSVDCPPSTIARYSQADAPVGSETVSLRVQSELVFHLVRPAPTGPSENVDRHRR